MSGTLQSQVQRVVRKGRRVRNTIATRFGAQPAAFVQVFGRDITIGHRGTHADVEVINQCFQAGQYDMRDIGRFPMAGVDAFYRGVATRGLTPLILDAGANIGAGALWFAARYPAAEIVCIEPDPGNFALLAQNCPGPAFDLRQCGLDAEDGGAVLTDPGEGEWAYRTAAAGEGVAIRMISLRTIMAGKPPARYVPFILKIDIEGAERSLFAADETLYDAFPVIVMEPHDWMFHGEGTCLNFLRFHVAHRRDFYFHSENIFSVKQAILAY